MGAFKNETVKLFKTKYAYIFTAIIIVQTAIAVYIQKVQPDGWHTVITTQNAPSLPLAFINTTAQFMSVFIAIYAAWIVADEYKKGTLKLSLFGSVSRTGLLHSKIFALLLFNVFIIVLNVIAAYAIGIAAFGWSGFATYKGIVFSPTEGIIMTFLAYGATIFPNMAFGMIALFIAIKTESMSTSIVLTVGLSYAGQLLYAIESLRLYSLSTQMHFFPNYILDKDAAQVIIGVAIILTYFTVFYVLSNRAINAKDIVY